MTGTPATFDSAPELLVDGAVERDLARGLQSLAVHSVDGRSDTSLRVLGRVDDLLPRGFSFGTTEIGVRVDGEEVFGGTLDQLDLRAPEGEPPSLLLHASGTAGAARSRRTVSVLYGEDLVAVSVRRRADTTRARCVLRSTRVHCGSRIRMATPDPVFDGVLTVVELWHRY